MAMQINWKPNQDGLTVPGNFVIGDQLSWGKGMEPLSESELLELARPKVEEILSKLPDKIEYGKQEHWTSVEVARRSTGLFFSGDREAFIKKNVNFVVFELLEAQLKHNDFLVKREIEKSGTSLYPDSLCLRVMI